MVLPLIAGGAMLVGGIAKSAIEADAKKREVDAMNKQVAQGNVDKNRAIADYTSGTQKGVENMSGAISKAQTDALNNPLYNPAQTRSYGDLSGSFRSDSERAISDLKYKDALSKGYSPAQAQAFAMEASTAQGASIGKGADNIALRDTALKALSGQNELSNVMRARAMGETPSLAQQQMLAGLDRTAQQQAGLAAQQRGGMSALLAQRNAQMMGGQAMQQASREGGMMALEERERAIGQYGNQLGALRSDATQRDLSQGSLDMQTNLANVQHRQFGANLAQNANQFNAQQLQQANLANLSNRQNVNLANVGAQNQARQFGANAYNTNQQFNTGNQMQLGLAKAGMTQQMLNNELANKMALEQYNVANRQQTGMANASFQQSLANRGLDNSQMGAFVDRDSSILRLQNPNQMQGVAPSMAHALGSGAMGGMSEAGKMYLMQNFNKLNQGGK